MTTYKALRSEQFIARGILGAFFIVAVVFVNIIIPVYPGWEFERLFVLSVYSFLAIVYLFVYSGVEHYEKRQAASADAAQT